MAISDYLPLVGPAFGGITGYMNNKYTQEANDKNIALQKEINEQNIWFARENRDLARMWALDDWNRTNQYNHPLQMMQRFKEAGLNPHLIYGQGAQTTAPMVRSSEAPRPQLTAARVAPLSFPDIESLWNSAFDIQAKQAQTDNLKAQNDLLKKDAMLKDLQILGKTTDNERKGFDLQFLKDIRDSKVQEIRIKNAQSLAATEKSVAEMNKTNLESSYIGANFNLKVQEMRLKQAKTSAEIESINKDILIKTFENTNMQPEKLRKLKQEVDNLEKTGMLKQIDLNLRNAGLNPQDPAYMRILVQIGMQLAEKYGIKLDGNPGMPADPLKMLHESPPKYQIK